MPRCYFCGERAALSVPKPGGQTVHVCIEDLEKVTTAREIDDELLRKAGLLPYRKYDHD